MQQEVTGVPCSCPCVKEACPPERSRNSCIFLLVKSAREVPAFRFFPEKEEEDVSSGSTCNVKVSLRQKMNGSCLINSSIVLGLRIIGKGFSAGKKLCAFLVLPFLSKLVFRNQERKLLKATERVAQENINAALSEIKGSNSFTKCGISIDGTWQRRGYSSLNGCVSAISVDTGKILDIEVMTQYCHICAKGNSQSSKHVCSNYKGSAGNMEVVGAYRIFERSNVRNVQYNEYYGDGDSKGYESVKNFYGINTVTKLECIGHVQKRVGGGCVN
ncbi:uncharacterized protein TNCV_2077171 [Trichonephila clavipes]|nr:uncharacterized protein TNCV_2077171 [Trichonephila clavipes]